MFASRLSLLKTPLTATVSAGVRAISTKTTTIKG